MNSRRLTLAALVLTLAMLAPAALAQNPIQWSGNVQQSVARANEQVLPLLFWVTGGSDRDDDDLSDAQSECFRDPAVVAIVHKCFVPVRVSRSSKVLDEAQRLGLPTAHGLYCAVLTADGRLLDQMGPAEVADPAAFADHLNQAYSRFCGDLYEKELRPLLEDPAAPKAKVRLALQTVWRLGIGGADKAAIGVLARKDLTPGETARLYDLLAALGTESCIATLLDRADDKAAAKALQRAEPGALRWIIPALPNDDAAPSARQLAAYSAAAQICRLSVPKAPAWWDKAAPEDRRKEIERLVSRAQTVLEYAQAKGAGR